MVKADWLCYNTFIMRKRQNEEKIYEAALKQFAKYGYKKTTLDDIAQKLNMTNANLYSYASSKQALYHDSVAYALTKWQSKVKEAIEGIDDPVERLSVLSDSAVLYLSENKTFCQILKRDPEIFPLFPNVDAYEEINELSYDILRDTLTKGVEAGLFIDMDIERSTMILFAIYKALIFEAYIQNENGDFMQTYNEIRKLLLNGILKR